MSRRIGRALRHPVHLGGEEATMRELMHEEIEAVSGGLGAIGAPPGAPPLAYETATAAAAGTPGERHIPGVPIGYVTSPPPSA